RSMKTFAYDGADVMAPADLNSAIGATLVMARSEYHDVADVVTVLTPLPPVVCLVAELNQVFLNLIVNASQAIAEKVGDGGRRGTLTVRSRLDGDHVVVVVADTGGGIPIAIREKIFDPFFTTKDVGKGTGQGLAICRSVVDKHGGALTFETDVGVGTTFFVRIPLQPKRPGAA